MPEMQYKDYLKRLTQQFGAQFEEILTEYNFDYGIEFEVALCEVLRKILPQKYGICRGFAISANNYFAGDDIIIYDREGFPTLRFLPQDSYVRKEYIPVEAVYAYIEAKYTLNIEGDEDDDEQSYSKACSQVANVKQLPREEIPHGREMPGWPNIVNPLFGAVFAYRVRKKKKKPILKGANAINAAIVEAFNNKRLPEISPSPDLIVAGDGVVMLPLYRQTEQDLWTMSSPFFVEGSSFLISARTYGHAFAMGTLILLHALQNIHLGRMPWHKLIVEGLLESERNTLENWYSQNENM